MLKRCFWAMLFPVMFFSFVSDNPAVSYIDTYKDYAIVEMHRSGIPASITLAQGLHETGNGTSELAKYAKNHFGIKCKSYWVGRKYFHKDDDRNSKGELIKSCFRVYDTPLDSYIDHSNFLMFSDRYNNLFDFDKTDYVAWAHGLKKCGYSTDPNYANKLIDKIHRFNLQEYDHVSISALKK